MPVCHGGFEQGCLRRDSSTKLVFWACLLLSGGLYVSAVHMTRGGCETVPSFDRAFILLISSSIVNNFSLNCQCVCVALFHGSPCHSSSHAE